MKIGIHQLRDKDIIINEDDLFIDCGAHIGQVIDWVIPYNCNIIAFEPLPEAFNFLINKYRNNSKVKVYNKAVWIENTIKPFYLKMVHKLKKNDGSSLIADKLNVSQENSINVETIDLAEFILSLNKRVFLKIDIEGAEIEVMNRIIDLKAYEKCELILLEARHHVKNVPSIKNENKLGKLIQRISKEKIENIILE